MPASTGYRGSKATESFAGPDPLRRLPSSQSQGSLRRNGPSSLPPSAVRNPQSRPPSRPLVPRVPLEQSEKPSMDEAVEVMQIGSWSVRRPAQPDARPIFVDLRTGLSQEEPPEEVLRELAADSEGGEAAEEPSFRRIVLGNHNETPLMMARDILAALRDDASLFDQIQSRFSDTAAEPALELTALPKELVEVAAGLAPQELSDVLATEFGMQMILRVS